jgi:hypothetical protein
MENYPKRRKSSVMFSPVVQNLELLDNKSETSEMDVTNDLESRSYNFPSSNRLSIFRRMSEISLQTLSTKDQFFFLCSSFLIFLMGIVVCAVMVKIFLSLSSSHVQVTNKLHTTQTNSVETAMGKIAGELVGQGSGCRWCH